MHLGGGGGAKPVISLVLGFWCQHFPFLLRSMTSTVYSTNNNAENYTVLAKSHPFIIFNNSTRRQSILTKFGMQHLEEMCYKHFNILSILP